jgi:1-acyl-sn-glycerol-3-phosphate acyltransferase
VDAAARVARRAAPPSGSPEPGLLGRRVRAAFFFVWTLLLSIPLFSLMAAIFPAVWVFDRLLRRGEHAMNTAWAFLSGFPFYRVEVVGADLLPAASEPAVYVSNHRSFLDIFSLFRLNRPFKFVSKTSNFMIPVIGWSMFLTGHLMLKRTDRRSQMQVLKDCVALLKAGGSVLLFPEGTRSRDGVMGEFKKGAFSIAVKAGVPVVPVTLVGTGDLMPETLELNPGTIRIVVHPPLHSEDAADLLERSRAAVASALPGAGAP